MNTKATALRAAGHRDALQQVEERL
jgi:hypothetical protein